MRRPATFGDFLMACVYAVGVVQLAAAGFVSLWAMGGTFVTASKRGVDLPVWIMPLDLVLCLLAIGVMAVAYRQGHLDTYEVRRHRQRRDGGER